MKTDPSYNSISIIRHKHNMVLAQENAPSPSDDLNWVSSIRYDFGRTNHR